MTLLFFCIFINNFIIFKITQHYLQMKLSSLPKKENRMTVFPTKLPSDFHGPIKPRLKLASIHQAKLKQRRIKTQQPDGLNLKVSMWWKKKTDKDVLEQRQQKIIHPMKGSPEVPEWIQSTSHFYLRSQQRPRIKEQRQVCQKYDIFGKEKKIIFAQKPSKRGHSEPTNITGKIGCEIRVRSVTKDKEVTDKVGSLYTRDFSVKKTVLKIGKSESVDTYTPF